MAQNKRLIEACRTYMENTGMPPSGISAQKVGLVADTLSYTMRENNQLKKEISIEKGETRESELDDKIKAHKERLEKKDGYLDRKRAAESKRLEKEKRIRDLIKDTAKRCQDSLDKLALTRIGKKGSSSYEKMHKVLEEGAKLDDQTSVSEMTDFLKRFTNATESYRNSHDTLIGPRTDDGKDRLNESKAVNAYGLHMTEQLKDLSAGLGEKNTPIGLKIKHSEQNLTYINNRQKELEGTRKEETIKELKQAAQPAPVL